MFLSFHLIHLYVPEGCSVLAAKTSLKTRSWRVLKDTSIRQKQYAGKEMNYLSHTVHLPDHGSLNCTHRALNAKKCSIWRHRFKPKFPLRSLTNCSVLWDSQLLHNSQTAMVTEGMTTWSAWETDENTHLTADYRGALESKLLTGTEAIFNTLCSLCQIIQLYTHRLSRHWHFWEVINENQTTTGQCWHMRQCKFPNEINWRVPKEEKED